MAHFLHKITSDLQRCSSGILSVPVMFARHAFLPAFQRKDARVNLRTMLAAFALLLLPCVISAQTYLIDFETDAMGMMIMDGDDVEHAYMDWGVHITRENHTGDPTNHHNGMPYATNTNTFVTSTDTGLGYDPIMGNILHAYGDIFTPGWSQVNGDPMLHLMFERPVSFLSVDFIGDSEEMSHLMVYDGMDLVQHLHVTRGGGGVVRNETLTYSGATPITVAMLGLGSMSDWVGVDNIRFTYALQAVPEPGVLTLFGGMAVGGVLALRRKKG
jgi:hypothetical protein